MKWKACTPYFVISAICFFAAAGSALVESLGPPVIFGFATLCSVFLTFGALASKEPEEGRARDPEETP